MPILLYGTENWIMTEHQWQKLRVLPGWTSEEDAQMAQTSLKHCCSSCGRCLDNKTQGSDSEVEIPPENDEE